MPRMQSSYGHGRRLAEDPGFEPIEKRASSMEPENVMRDVNQKMNRTLARRKAVGRVTGPVARTAEKYPATTLTVGTLGAYGALVGGAVHHQKKVQRERAAAAAERRKAKAAAAATPVEKLLPQWGRASRLSTPSLAESCQGRRQQLNGGGESFLVREAKKHPFAAGFGGTLLAIRVVRGPSDRGFV